MCADIIENSFSSPLLTRPSFLYIGHKTRDCPNHVKMQRSTVRFEQIWKRIP